MYLNQTMGNILNRFNNQKINVLYDPQNNLFDLLLSECGITLIVKNREHYNFLGLKNSNIVLINPEQESLFNYNIGMTNNIIGYSTNKEFAKYHLNSIIFTHSSRPLNIKKEDLVLLDRNLNRETKVFFNEHIADTWRLNNRAIYSYGVPLDKLYIDNKSKDRSKRILVLNIERSPNIEPLVQFLKTHNIQADILNQLHFDIDLVRDLFNQYEICIDFNDHNIINMLCAISCGCKCITYATPTVTNLYNKIPNLYSAKSVQDIILTIQSVMSTPHLGFESFFAKNYCFDTFKNRTLNIIDKLNSEAFIL